MKIEALICALLFLSLSQALAQDATGAGRSGSQSSSQTSQSGQQDRGQPDAVVSAASTPARVVAAEMHSANL